MEGGIPLLSIVLWRGPPNVQGSTAQITKHNTHTPYVHLLRPSMAITSKVTDAVPDPTHLRLAPPLSPSFLSRRGRRGSRRGWEMVVLLSPLQDGEGSNDSSCIGYIFAHMAVAPLCDGSAASYRFRRVNGGPVMWCVCWVWCYERRLIRRRWTVQLYTWEHRRLCLDSGKNGNTLQMRGSFMMAPWPPMISNDVMVVWFGRATVFVSFCTFMVPTAWHLNHGIVYQWCH